MDTAKDRFPISRAIRGCAELVISSSDQSLSSCRPSISDTEDLTSIKVLVRRAGQDLSFLEHQEETVTTIPRRRSTAMQVSVRCAHQDISRPRLDYLIAVRS